MNLFIKQKQTLRHIGNNLTATTGKSWGWHKLGTWINRYSLLYIRQINNKVLLRPQHSDQLPALSNKPYTLEKNACTFTRNSVLHVSEASRALRIKSNSKICMQLVFEERSLLDSTVMNALRAVV